jgi:hypothetical protein
MIYQSYGYENCIHILRGRTLAVGGKICYELSDYFQFIDTNYFSVPFR